MGDMLDNIVRDFSNSELILVAEQLGLSPTSRWGSRRLVEAIRSRLDKQGIPESIAGEDDALSRKEVLLEEFLYVAGYVDEDGNPEKKGGTDVTIGMALEAFLAKYSLQKPACYAFADDGDPACHRCPIYRWCAEERISNLPPCYGLMHSDVEPECKKCIDRAFCRQAYDT